MINAVLCRYGEVALKGGNRRHFERLLLKAIRRALPELADLQILRERGRILLHHTRYAAFTEAEVATLLAALPHVFGLHSFSPGTAVRTAMPAIEEAVDQLFPVAYAAVESAIPEGPIRFRVRARRSNKLFPLDSLALNLHFAARLVPRYPRFVVNLTDADITLYLEVREEWSFTYCHTYAAPGGMPSGSAAPGLALLSGGIDSPVACHLTMKRGACLDFLTFHSFPYTTEETVAKVARLVAILNGRQPPGRYFACNLSEAQKQIRDNCTESYRTVLYRRLMMRIANRIAAHFGNQFIVTGESIGQVASQTIPNLQAIDSASERLVLRPLITMDKDQTVALARQVGTYDISIEPCTDSCTVFAPREPATATKPDRLARDESRLDIEALVNMSLAATTAVDPVSLVQVPWDAAQAD